MEMSHLYSASSFAMKASAIRELLKITNIPGMISFAGGLPDPATFPVLDLQIAADRVLATQASKALQYGTTEGDEGLKEEIIKFEASNGTAIEKDDLLIVSASQQALDLLCKVFLDPGDMVLAGRPTYLGEIQAIQSYRAGIIGVPFSPERDGFDMDALESQFRQATSKGISIKYIYVIPDFQNPSGICWSLEKRLELLEFSYRNSLLVVEDSPYREIRFLGAPIPTLFQLDQRGRGMGNVVCCRTFSKTLAPGTRLGWIFGPKALVTKLVIAKQAMDLCTNVFVQMWIAEYMRAGTIHEHIAQTCNLYRNKRNRMMEALEKSLPQVEGLEWTRPEGGLFMWLSLPERFNTDAMFARAIEQKVAYVVGSVFYFDSPECKSMRINFSYSSLEQIDEGVERLGRVIGREIESMAKSSSEYLAAGKV